MKGIFEKNDLNNLAKILPAFLIFIGSVKLIIFYSCFGIKIVNYIEFTEVLISFLDTAITILTTLFIPALILIVFLGRQIGEKNQKSFEQVSSLNFSARIVNDFKNSYLVIIMSIVVLIVLLVTRKWNLVLLMTIISYLGIFILIFLIREIRIALQKHHSYEIPVTYLNISMFVYMFCNIVISDTLRDVRAIKQEHIYFGTEIFLEKETITCDSVLTYVGQTRNYLFMYNLNQDKSIVIPKVQMLKLVLLNK